MDTVKNGKIIWLDKVKNEQVLSRGKESTDTKSAKRNRKLIRARD